MDVGRQALVGLAVALGGGLGVCGSGVERAEAGSVGGGRRRGMLGVGMVQGPQQVKGGGEEVKARHVGVCGREGGGDGVEDAAEGIVGGVFAVVVVVLVVGGAGHGPEVAGLGKGHGIDGVGQHALRKGGKREAGL